MRKILLFPLLFLSVAAFSQESYQLGTSHQGKYETPKDTQCGTCRTYKVVRWRSLEFLSNNKAVWIWHEDQSRSTLTNKCNNPNGVQEVRELSVTDNGNGTLTMKVINHYELYCGKKKQIRAGMAYADINARLVADGLYVYVGDVMGPLAKLYEGKVTKGQKTSSVASMNNAKGSKTENTSDENNIVSLIDKHPEFPGGRAALSTFLSSNIVYPEGPKSMGIEGKVFVQFVVSSTGEIRDIKIVKGADPHLDQEALRVIKLMPRWSPGEQNGKAVNVRTVLPINFTL